MNLKFPTIIYFLSAILAGFFLIHYPHELVSFAEVGNISSNEAQEIDIDRLKQNNVIYLGENHDNSQHHAQQLEIIQQLQQETNNSQLAIGMEMFQRPFQPILNRYLAQKISEEELRQQTEYDTRWGFDWEFYAPILRYAQREEIPVIALNTPEEITHKVAETGINSLEGSDFRYIPPFEEIKLDNEEYRQAIEEIYLQHVEDGQGNSTDVDNFFAAQVLWDETMAEAIALHYLNNPQAKIVILVGKAHVTNNYAIPDRVTRRINNTSFSSKILLQ
ncbi:MAG: ChaN family lipoprotein [Pleurocapsa sp.]